MIIVKPNAATDRPKYAFIATYGDRCVLGASPDDALHRAWATWGGDVPALVHPSCPPPEYPQC